jgi:hypothetical protein
MSLRLASETNPLVVAWNAYDAAALRLAEMYRNASKSSSPERMLQALEVNRLWEQFRKLMADCTPEDPTRPAA